MELAEYLDSVLQIIRSNGFKLEGFKASTLGALIRRALPDDDWRDHGFPTLKSLLQHIEQNSSAITTGNDSSGAFAVWIKTRPPEAISTALARKYSPLKKEIWLAFVSAQPLGKRFIHRTSGTVRMGLRESPHPAEQWVEIVPVSDNEQRRWAESFIESNCADSALKISLDSPHWFSLFASALRNLDPGLARNWNRSRSERISKHVTACFEKHKLDPAIAFVQANSTVSEPPVADKKGTDERARVVLLAAIARMSTNELAQLPIPARYLLREVGL